jgi:hypothetical protein
LLVLAVVPLALIANIVYAAFVPKMGALSVDVRVGALTVW